MNNFSRRLEQFHLLQQRNDAPAWWNDLLSLWCPSGSESGEHGLRLAIRDNYMNFYRRGQSVARVKIGSDGRPRGETHIKYVSRGKAGASQEYLALKGNEILRKGEPFCSYEGIGMLKEWIDTINGNQDNKGYTGVEKNLVDKLVAANQNVIDLEMGLPADKDRASAVRMDMIDIEMADDEPQIVFWEVKHISDGRLRRSGDENPKVVDQLTNYRNFLSVPANRVLVTDAYRASARLLQQLRDIALKLETDTFISKMELNGEIWKDEALASMKVDSIPRLLVINGPRVSQTAWETHAKKIQDAGFPIQLISEEGPYRLECLS